MGDVPAVVVVGAASRDLVHDDPRGWRLGGGVSYAALTLARLGLRVGALIGADRLAAESRELHVLRDAGVEVAVARLDRGPVFINTETPNGRIQHAAAGVGSRRCRRRCRQGGGGPARGCSARSRPSCRTRGPRCRREDALVALGWQGLLRVLVAGEPVTQHPPGPSPIVARSDLVGVGSDDVDPSTPDAELLAFLHPGATMLLTDGAHGGLAIDVARGRRSRAPPPVAARAGRALRGPGRCRRHVPRRRVRGAHRPDAARPGRRARRRPPASAPRPRRSSARDRAWSASRPARPSCGGCGR